MNISRTVWARDLRFSSFEREMWGKSVDAKTVLWEIISVVTKCPNINWAVAFKNSSLDFNFWKRNSVWNTVFFLSCKFHNYIQYRSVAEQCPKSHCKYVKSSKHGPFLWNHCQISFPHRFSTPTNLMASSVSREKKFFFLSCFWPKST